MKIIIAPNSFKGSLDAFEVAKAIEKGLQKSMLEADCRLFPIADGGDHTLEVFVNWLGGEVKSTEVRDPLGRPVVAEWAMLTDGKTAVIEMAKASGLSLLESGELNPLKTNTYGTGQLIAAAVESGAGKIILGLGGSATVDGGTGILQALGAKFYDEKGNLIGQETNALLDIIDIDTSGIPKTTWETEFLILCDVENPLLGPHGAAQIFGPQKGADPHAVKLLEKAMERYSNLITKKTGKELADLPGLGAAGGIAMPLKAFFNTNLVSGVDFILKSMGFEEEIRSADWLITAEGKADRQTLEGKGPFGVARSAKIANVPTILLTGEAKDIEELNKGFTAVFPITNGPASLEEAMASTAHDLEMTAMQIGNLLATKR